VSQLESLARRHVLDLLIAAGALAAALEVVLRDGQADAADTSLWFAAPASTLVVLPLLGRRRWPFAGPLAVFILAAAVSFADGRLVTGTATLTIVGLAASFLLGQLRDAPRSRLGLAIEVCALAILVANDPDRAAADFVLTPALFAIAWLGGLALRERAAHAEVAEARAAHAEHERETAARIAVAEERTRIARELHDIVAHAVSVMVLQVGAVRHKLPPELESDREALTAVERTGRDALGEMRRLLGAMRQGAEDLELGPQPGLAGLDSLLDAFRRSGLPVELHVQGDPVQLPPPLDLSAYRIVQEGLTNTLKHARAHHADVVIDYAPDALGIDVRDDGEGSGTGNGLGHGLVGIRERVKIYGGEITAGPASGGGYLLSARIPLDGGRP
jgi:signal transduction histidine kinase